MKYVYSHSHSCPVSNSAAPWECKYPIVSVIFCFKINHIWWLKMMMPYYFSDFCRLAEFSKVALLYSAHTALVVGGRGEGCHSYSFIQLWAWPGLWFQRWPHSHIWGTGSDAQVESHVFCPRDPSSHGLSSFCRLLGGWFPREQKQKLPDMYGLNQNWHNVVLATFCWSNKL